VSVGKYEHSSCLFTSFYLSEANAKDKEHQIVTFQSGTGITNLRNHLTKFHLQAWTKACSDGGIKMCDASLETIKKFQGHDNEEVEHLPFTKEAFSEALMEFVVGDDVVSKNGHMKLYSLLIWISP